MSRTVVTVGGLAMAIGLALLARSMRPKQALPLYGEVPSFKLVDQRGAAYTTASMLGHATVVDFVFTHCTSSCPRLTAQMAELQKRFAKDGSDARLASFSVDPENDTPPVLADYAARAGADPARWTFVTGPADDVIRAVVQGFKVSAAKIERGAADSEVTHGDWFVLVDAAGHIRGYYPTDDERDIDHVIEDAERLAAEKP
jgi:protein SCO1/2